MIAKSSDSDQLMYELEQKIGVLLSRYQGMQSKLASISRERESLACSCTEKDRRIETLEQQLAMMALAQSTTYTESSEGGARSGLVTLREEVAGLTLIIDECITLLEQRME